MIGLLRDLVEHTTGRHETLTKWRFSSLCGSRFLDTAEDFDGDNPEVQAVRNSATDLLGMHPGSGLIPTCRDQA
jgi:hypothetical protein